MTTRSWLGKEDFDLEPALQRERPGIFLWALDGLGRLAANGWRFTPNPSSTDVLIQLRDLASPIGAFVREQCTLDPNSDVPTDLLYGTWKIWATNNGHRQTSKETFGRDLQAAYPMVRRVPVRNGIDRYRVYRGIRLKPSDESAGEDDDARA
jgi:putative DNA primase/helicase